MSDTEQKQKASSAVRKKTLNSRALLVNRKELLFAVGLAVASVLIVLLAAIPQFREIMSLRSQIAKDTQKLEKLQRKLAQLEEISFNPDYQQREVVFDALPSRKPLLEVLNSLVVVVRDTGVKVDQLELNPGSIATDSATVQAKSARSKNSLANDLGLDIVVSGSFDNMQQFFAQVEQMSPFTTISQLALSDSRTEIGGTPRIRAQLTMDTYYYTQTIAQTLEADLPTIGDQEREVLAELASFTPGALPEQLEITGGGLEEFFEVDSLLFEQGL